MDRTLLPLEIKSSFFMRTNKQLNSYLLQTTKSGGELTAELLKKYSDCIISLHSMFRKNF